MKDVPGTCERCNEWVDGPGHQCLSIFDGNAIDVVKAKAAEPFGRQPEKVTVRFEGDPRDVQYWMRHFARAAEFKGDQVQLPFVGDCSFFTIYPRAVSD